MKKTTNYKLQTTNRNSGFSLVELIVTVGIIVLVSSLVLAKYPDFSEKQSLDRASRTIALSIRDVQIRAMSSREFANIFPAYGVHFESGVNDKFIIFADYNPENQKYDDGEAVEEKKIITSARIADLRADQKSGSNPQERLSDIDIIFKRPDPLIFLRANNGVLQNFSDLEVILRQPGGKEKTVGVWLSGQVFIE